jgi:Fe-S oxidoreductase
MSPVSSKSAARGRGVAASRLPLVDAHPGFERAHTFCAFCPKLCRFACPVSTVEGRETTTPWAKMSAVHHAAAGHLPLDASVAETFWACSGCQRCKSFCNHENEVASALDVARAEAVRAGVAPRAALEVRERHAARVAGARAAAAAIFEPDERHGSGRGDGARDRDGDAGARGRATDAGRAGGEVTVFVPGCTACVRTPDAARDGAEATRLLGGGRMRVEADGCCGLPLLEAGDLEGFVGAARALLARLEGAREAVFQDPGCLHAMVVEARRHGVTGGPPLLHLSEFGARHLGALGAVGAIPGPAGREIAIGRDGARDGDHDGAGSAPEPGRTVGAPGPEVPAEVRYHDACRLGRGLGIYDAPRSVLAAALGRAPAEFAERRERAECAGAGGQLPRTAPETARGIARERVDAHERAGGGVIVTTCAASAVALRRAGAEVADFASVLLRSARAGTRR